MRPRASRAFTLTELLVVVAIMGLLAALSIPALRGVAGAGKFNQAVSSIAGLFELARSQAIAQNTYAWVVLYQIQPGDNSGYQTFAVAYTSNDGTDPFAAGGTTVTFPPGTVVVNGNTTTLTPVSRFLVFPHTGLVVDGSGPALPNSPGTPTYPAATPTFSASYTGIALPTSTSGTTRYAVVEFTPGGSVRYNGGMTDALWLGLYAVKGKDQATPNVASLKISGLTGLVTVYRK